MNYESQEHYDHEMNMQAGTEAEQAALATEGEAQAEQANINANEPVVSEFQKEISTLINKHSRENMSDTPDFILAQYLESCLTAYSVAVSRRDQWFGVDMWTSDKQVKITTELEF